MFDIEEFKAQVESKNGVLRPNKFKISLVRPNVMTTMSPNDSRDISFWCQSINLPGFQFNTHDIKRWTYGPIEKRPFAPNFQQLQLQMIADSDMKIWKFFHDWMQYIMPHDRANDNGLDGESATFGGSHYEVAYKYNDDGTNYVVDFKIEVYRETGDLVKTVVCKEAFPSQVLTIPLSWQELNTYAQYAVMIDYVDWYEEIVTQANRAFLTDIDQGE